ncbi:hypothetical protein AGMMS50289_17570 [Betaproteobacteria bacterium]|nr:hypothetical protein AGMMS50289_17570 [Betaproteobacteria bacterium]
MSGSTTLAVKSEEQSDAAISLVAKIAASLRSSLLTRGGGCHQSGALFDPALPNALVVRQTAYSIAGLITHVNSIAFMHLCVERGTVT